MKITIRTDGSKDLGMGNVFRSLALAEKIRLSFPEAQLTFICKNNREAINEIRKREFSLYILPKNISSSSILTSFTLNALRETGSSLIINDIKDTDLEYVRTLKKNLITVINFDDLGKGRELADYLFDAFLFNEAPRPGRNDFYGPDYLVLREEFLAAKKEKIHQGKVSVISVLLGGANSANLMPEVLKALSLLPESIKCHIILGKAVAGAELFQLEYSRKNFTFHYNPENLPLLLSESDLAITAGGISMCEALSLGTPVVVVPQVPHEADNAAFFADKSAVYALPYNPELSSENIYRELKKIIFNPVFLSQMSEKGPLIIDGKGLERVFKAILPIFSKLN